MLRYSRHVLVFAEGPNVKITRTQHYQLDEECESSVLYQHVMLGAQDEFQNWLKQQREGMHKIGRTLKDSYVRHFIPRIAAKWTKDLSTEVLLLLAADDRSLVEYQGDWPAGQSAIETIRSSLKADILITLATLWVDTCRELLSSAGE